MLNNVVRAVCGTVKFSATNGFCERLINLCACNNLSFSQIEKTQEGFTAIVPSFDIKKVMELAEKSNVDVEIISQNISFIIDKEGQLISYTDVADILNKEINSSSLYSLEAQISEHNSITEVIKPEIRANANVEQTNQDTEEIMGK